LEERHVEIMTFVFGACLGAAGMFFLMAHGLRDHFLDVAHDQKRLVESVTECAVLKTQISELKRENARLGAGTNK